MADECEERIFSDAFMDLLWRRTEGEEQPCSQPLGDGFVSFFVDRAYFSEVEPYIFSFHLFPHCFGLLQTESLYTSGILQVQNRPGLELKGKGVILGFVDTGIDYQNTCFRDPAGDSRILELWDQTDRTGSPPEGFHYGSVYTREDVNRALRSGAPEKEVPSRDEDGHGTILASIAAGSEDAAADRRGAAPLADLAVVKLKEAKPYLKEFFLIPEGVKAYQENDMMAGIAYLNRLALREEKPLVLCLALGSNQGGHEGTGPLSQVLNSLSLKIGRACAAAVGNEANQGHHFFGSVERVGAFREVEIRVAPGSYGFTMELWGKAPDVFSVSLISPSGEVLPRIYLRTLTTQEYRFVFEPTIAYLNFTVQEAGSGDQLLVIRMRSPSPGVWRLRVYGNEVVDGSFHLWLPMAGFLTSETRFLLPDPDVTITEPANGGTLMSTAGYNGANDSIFLDSGRGYARRGGIRPDFAAPAVNVEAVGLSNRVTHVTGTSASAALSAGAAALLLEWGIVRGGYPLMNGVEVKNDLIRGAKRRPDLTYPNREWGYGTLNLLSSFETFIRPRPE